MLQGLRRRVRIITKTFCDNTSKRGKDYREFVDESQEDISGLAQIWVIPSAKKRAGQLLLLVQGCTDRMSQRRFAHSGQAVDPVYIAVVLPPGSISCPVYKLLEVKFAGAFHTLQILAIAGLDGDLGAEIVDELTYIINSLSKRLVNTLYQIRVSFECTPIAGGSYTHLDRG